LFGRESDTASDEELFKLQKRIQQAGGDPLAGVAQDVKAATAALRNAAEERRAVVKPQVAPAMPGPPPRIP
jgi:hypothetical protein